MLGFRTRAESARKCIQMLLPAEPTFTWRVRAIERFRTNHLSEELDTEMPDTQLICGHTRNLQYFVSHHDLSQLDNLLVLSLQELACFPLHGARLPLDCRPAFSKGTCTPASMCAIAGSNGSMTADMFADGASARQTGLR